MPDILAPPYSSRNDYWEKHPNLTEEQATQGYYAAMNQHWAEEQTISDQAQAQGIVIPIRYSPTPSEAQFGYSASNPPPTGNEAYFVQLYGAEKGPAAYQAARSYYSSFPSERFQTAIYDYSVKGGSQSVNYITGRTAEGNIPGFIPYNTPATISMVTERAEMLGRQQQAGIISTGQAASGASELARQYGYTPESISKIVTIGAEKEREQQILTKGVDYNAIYAVSYKSIEGTSAGAVGANILILPGIALTKPELLPATQQVQFGMNQETGAFPKEGKYTYLGVYNVKQHGESATGYLYKSAEGAYAVVLPSKEIIGLSSTQGQEVPMSGGQAAWEGMTESGRIALTRYSPVLENVTYTQARNIKTGEITDLTVMATASANAVTGGTTLLPVTEKSVAYAGLTENQIAYVEYGKEMFKSVINVNEQLLPEQQTSLKPSGIDQWVSTNLGGIPIVPGVMITASDFFIGGREMVTTTSINGETYEKVTQIESGLILTQKNVAAGTTQKYLPEVQLSESDMRTAVKGASLLFPGLTAHTTNPLYGNQISDAIAYYAKGQYEGLKEKPFEAALMFGVGFGFGAGFKGAEMVGSKAATMAIEQYPTVTKGLTAINTKYLPMLLMGLYSVDIGIRTFDVKYTDSGIEFNTDIKKASEKFGGLSTTEIIPMFAGGYAGYSLADKFLSKYPGLYTVPNEAQIIAGAQDTERAVTKATLSIFKNVKEIESPLSGKPQFEKVSGVKEIAKQFETTIKSQEHSIFGRTVETGQMPEEWIAGRGITKDVDIFVNYPEQFGKSIAQKYPSQFVAKDQVNYKALISKQTQQTALDIHQFPETYPIGKTTGEINYTDTIGAILNPTPSKKGLFTVEGITQEKLYVQTQRKATSVIGEKIGEFGPPEHRMKDIYDLLNYTSYLSQYASGSRRARLEESFVTIQRYAMQKNIYEQFKGGKEMARAISELQFGKPPKIKISTKSYGKEDVYFSKVTSDISGKIQYSLMGKSISSLYLRPPSSYDQSYIKKSQSTYPKPSQSGKPTFDYSIIKSPRPETSKSAISALSKSRSFTSRQRASIIGSLTAATSSNLKATSKPIPESRVYKASQVPSLQPSITPSERSYLPSAYIPKYPSSPSPSPDYGYSPPSSKFTQQIIEPPISYIGDLNGTGFPPSFKWRRYFKFREILGYSAPRSWNFREPKQFRKKPKKVTRKKK